jgi:hypothetical protein
MQYPVLSVIMLSVIMLSVIMLNAVMLSVMAPSQCSLYVYQRYDEKSGKNCANFPDNISLQSSNLLPA